MKHHSLIRQLFLMILVSLSLMPDSKTCEIEYCDYWPELYCYEEEFVDVVIYGDYFTYEECYDDGEEYYCFYYEEYYEWVEWEYYYDEVCDWIDVLDCWYEWDPSCDGGGDGGGDGGDYNFPLATITPATSQTINLGQSLVYSSTALAGDSKLISHDFDWMTPEGDWMSTMAGTSGTGTVEFGALTGTTPRNLSLALVHSSTRSLSLTPVQMGTYTVRFLAADGQGNTGYSDEQSLTIIPNPKMQLWLAYFAPDGGTVGLSTITSNGNFASAEYDDTPARGILTSHTYFNNQSVRLRPVMKLPGNNTEGATLALHVTAPDENIMVSQTTAPGDVADNVLTFVQTGTYTIQITGSADWTTPNPSSATVIYHFDVLDDTAPPAVPTDLMANNIAPGSFLLSWTPSTDNAGVTGYEVRRNGQDIGSVSDAKIPVVGLQPNTTYSVEVRAYDAAGNYSDWSTPLSATTGASSGVAADELPALWAAQYGLTLVDALGDPDGDGLTNIAEYNLGNNPLHYDAGTSTLGNTVPAGWPSSSNGTHAVGTTAGEFSVDKNGAATYTVPIAVTPGTAGVEPKITLNYSSQAGPGIAGFGWSIGGLSAISRGPQTKLVDGQNRAMDFTRNDRFYLDGQRLVVIAGTYSYDGAEYRTEMESFTRVVSYGSTGNSPAWFKAWTKGGLVIEFGHTADSAFRPQNQTDPLSWAVSKISDTVGNYMTFHYEVEVTSGQQVLKSIKYTGHDGTPSVQPYASLEFEYEARPDTSFGYVMGAKISSLQRLKAVKSRHGSAVVRTYTLNYSQRDYNKRSILDSITETGTDGVAYHPLTFAYSNPLGGMQAMPAPFHLPTFIAKADSNGRLADQGVAFIDLNGDGRTDCVQKLGANGSVVNKAWLNTPDGWVEAVGTNGQPDYRLPNPLTLSTNNRNATNPDTGVRFADFNNDGLVDVMGSTGDTYLNTGAGFLLNQRFSLLDEPPSYDYYSWFSRGRPEVLDLDGDGRVDVSARSTFEYEEYDYYYNGYIYYSYDAYDTWINTGGGVEGDRGSAWAHVPEPEHTVPRVRGDTGTRYIDLNGDGLTDILQSYGTARRAYLRTPEGWSDTTAYHLPLPLFSSYATTSGLGGELVDLNGDGLPDFIAYNGGSANYQKAAYINTGKGWIPAPPAMLSPAALYYNNTPNGTAFIDFDSDGLPDLLASSSATHLNTGSGWMTATPDYRLPHALYQNNRGNPGNEFIDLNADGAVDLIWSWENNSTTTKGAYINRRINPDRLASVTNGLGVTVSVAYAPLTATVQGDDELVYEKGAGASFPVMDATGPMYVVKTVAHEDGAGGWYDIGYRYGGLRFHADRGSLGFAWMQVTDSRTQIHTKTFFSQEHPCIGLPVGSTTKQSNGKILSDTITTYDHLSLNNGKTTFPYAAQTIQRTRELDETITSETVTDYTYDIYGNAVEIVTDTSGGDGDFTKTVTSTYENWVAPPSSTGLGGWMLGRLLSSTVTTTAPNPDGGTSITQTRTSDFEYSTITGLLAAEIIEPDAPDDPVTQAPSPLKLTTTYAYDSFGNKTTVTTTGAGLGNGRTATTTYTTNGRFPLKTANALGHEESYAYDPALGVLLSTTGPNGLTTHWEYDVFARPSREIRADGTVSITRQCWAGPGAPEGALYYIETEATASAPAVVFYDKMGRAVSSWSVNPGVHNGLARIVTTETKYDEMGRAHESSLPHYLGDNAPGWTQTLLYDPLNRPLEVSTPDDEAADGAVLSSIEYDGLVTRTINPLDQVEQITKNTQGQVVHRVNNLNGTGVNKGEIRYYYDAYGSLLKTSVYRENGATVDTAFEYDNRGRKVGMTSPDMGTWTYQYNALGELVSQTDAKGQTTAMTYDALGRLATRIDRNAAGVAVTTTTWTYDDISAAGSGPKGKGKLSSVLVQTVGKPDYKETYLYDNLGRQTRLTRCFGSAPDQENYAVNQEYDSSGRPAVMIYPGGFRVRNIYSTLGFLKEVRADGGLVPSSWLNDVRLNHRFWQADAYTVTGAISGGTIGNGLTYDRVVSPVTGRVRAVVSGIGTGTHAQHHTYNYDALGQVVQRGDLVLGRNETFAYDGLNRLTQWQLQAIAGSGGTGVPPVVPKTVTQTYNALGNIVSKSDYGVYSYTGTGPHAVTSVYDAANNLTRSYTYDANGNMLSGAGRELEWTVFNQVETITQGALSTQFRFGAGRERVVQEHSDGTKTIYIGDIYEKVINTATGFTEEKYHVYSPFGKVATRTVRSDSLIETRYYHLDGLGSIVAVSDEWGRVEKRFAFDPWGKRELLTDTHTGQGGKVTRGFTGHEHLDDFGLIHMNGRVFDPALGRFLSADPTVSDASWSQSYNRYSYVDNNPLNATDPSGYFSLKKLLPTIIAIVVTVVVLVCTYGTASPAVAGFWGTVGASAVGGFAGGFSSVLINGGTLSQAFKAGVISGLISGATAAASYGVGTLFTNAAKGAGIWSNDFLNWSGRTLAHATVGGLASEAQGGEFRHGFYSSGFSTGIMHGGLTEFMGGNQGGWYVAGRTAVAALIGGTAAELAGGKFANGAWTSALQHLFNQETHRQASGSGTDKKEGWFTRAKRYVGRILSIHDPLNKELASTGLGYITPDGEFIYTGPQTITISSAGSLVQGLGFNAEGGFFISRGGVRDNFLFKFGSFESGSVQGGANASADFIRFGIYNTSDISGKFIDMNINTPLIGGGATFDGNFIPVGVSIGVGPGGFGASGGTGYTATQDWFKY